MESVRTRFAPSPTGSLHLGNARSALFPFLWARKNKGVFILRIEDTDRQREKEGAVSEIIDGLKWLGIQWDEGPDIGGKFGPYIQSARAKIYQKYAQELLERGGAYRCFCSPERLTAMRKEQQENHQPPQYDRYCRKLTLDELKKNLEAKKPYVIRLKVPEEGNVVVPDFLRGEISFPASDIDDQILIKSDGLPTYHLANVVDDHLMGITHVIRGVDWLPSTPKHVLLYQAFKWPIPTFVHLSLFLAAGGGKLSKREGATSLLNFRRDGYLAEALVNFIALLGWHPKKEQEFFSLLELSKEFELKNLHTANPVLDLQKLIWLNRHYLQQLDIDEVILRIEELAGQNYNPHYAEFISWFKNKSSQTQKSLWQIFRNRCSTLLEVAQTTQFLQKPDYDGSKLIWKKSNLEATISGLNKIRDFLSELADEYFTTHVLEEKIRAWLDKNQLKPGEILWPLRFALSGQEKSPPPFELIEILEKTETMERINTAIKKITS